MYLLIVFCLHWLAAWVAFGSEKISYMGLQIAIGFDLGVLKDYGPPKEIDPIRDRFIGIILGILIISTVFSLVWPETARSIAREKAAASLRAIARLLKIRGGSESNPQRERLELEIASHLAEANAFQEQATFEALIHGAVATNSLDLGNAAAAVEEVYAGSFPWIREQAASASAAEQETARGTPNTVKRVLGTVKASAAMIEGSSDWNIAQATVTIDDFLGDGAFYAGHSSECFEELVAAVKVVQVLVSEPLRAQNRDGS